MSAFQISPAQPQDAPGIAAAIGSGFAPEILAATIYGCEGIAKFIASQISLPQAVADTRYTVAEPRDSASEMVAGCSHLVAGCVEMRCFPDALFLNYISLLPQYRAAGMGKALLRAAIAQCREAQGEMLLDVLLHNEVARGWYQRLGFVDQHGSEWWEIHPERGEASPGFVSGFPHAEACQREFGFSQLNVTTADGNYAIGRIGLDWFRVTTPEALADPAVAATLVALDPNRRLLALLREGQLPAAVRPQARQMTRLVRMSVGLDDLVSRLGG